MTEFVLFGMCCASN